MRGTVKKLGGKEAISAVVDNFNDRILADETINQPEHFNAVAKHLADALADFNVPPADIDAVISHVATLKDDIIYK